MVVLLAGLFTALVTGPPVAGAETLEDAWRMSAEADAGLAAMRSRAEAGRAGERAARAERWPRLTVDGTWQRFDDAPAFSFPVGSSTFTSPELVDGDDLLMGRARVELPLITGGRVSSGIRAASQAARGAGLAEEGYAQSLRLRVATAYIDVLRARRAVRATTSAVASLQAHADAVAVMLEREAVARNDLLAARVTLADAEQARLRAESRQALAHAAYNRLVGQPMERVPDLAELSPAPADDAPLGELVARAVAGRRELAGSEARALALAEQARSESASRWPQIGLVADWQHLDNQVLDDDDFSLVGVGVTWTLFDGGRIRQRASALRSASRAAARERDDLESLVELEVREAWLDLAEARARVSLTRAAVDQAEENLRVARELYGVGLATNTVVLEAEALRLGAVGNNDNAVLDVVLGELCLRRAVGAL
jgi:outer membrane protein TolC